VRDRSSIVLGYYCFTHHENLSMDEFGRASSMHGYCPLRKSNKNKSIGSTQQIKAVRR